MSNRQRADVILVERNLFPTREKAKAAIMEGIVSFDGKVICKAGSLVDEECKIEIKQPPKYVSRGGIKLEKAISDFGLQIEDKIAIDVGVSTGGFTDCLLQAGARLVIAVDVGYGQIALRLRNDPKVFLLERKNIRNLGREEIPELADFAAIDLSFISVSKIIENLLKLLKAQAEIVVLVKPQFEAGRELVGKKGVVRDPDVHSKVLIELIDDLQDKGLEPRELTFSPLLGPKGNIEFLLYFTSGFGYNSQIASRLIEDVVAKAHSELRRK